MKRMSILSALVLLASLCTTSSYANSSRNLVAGDAWFTSGYYHVVINARGDMTSQDARGTFEFLDGTTTFFGVVSCLAISESIAVVTGTITSSSTSERVGQGFRQSILDRGPGKPDASLTQFSAEPITDCSTVTATLPWIVIDAESGGYNVKPGRNR